MTREEAINWLMNIRIDIGQASHSELWHYEQALADIIDLLETEPEVQVARDIATILENEQDMRVMLRPEIERKTGKWIENDIDPEAWNFCSECGEQSIDLYDYCPNCGAKMEVQND